MKIDVRRAHAANLDAAAETLAAAFEQYPWTRYVLPEADYPVRLRELQRLYLGYAHEHGIVAVTESCDGVIAILPLDAPDPEPEMVERILALHEDRIDRLGQSEAPADAWRLETLGVRPESQGGGRASALLDFALSEIAARGGTEVVLDTSDARNVRLYERHGFTITSHSEPLGRPPLWAMSRRG